MTSKLAVGAVALAFLASGCNSPARRIRPVIHAYQDDKYEAMKSAPIVVLAEVLDIKRASGVREVNKPPGMAGPQSPTIPMALSRISARVILSLRGNQPGTIQFYSWCRAGQMHGGPRLFHVVPGTFHVLFLRQEGSYLHTVGDYPAYDMEIPPEGLPGFIAGLKADSESKSDLFERVVRVRLTAELARARHFAGFDQWVDLDTLEGLTSPLYVAGLLDSFCRQFPNAFGRFNACVEAARQYVGRCNAYHFAREAADSVGLKAASIPESLKFCRAFHESRIEELRAWRWPPYFYNGWRETPERRRLALRVFASAMDPEFHTVACEMPEARNIPECASSGPRMK